MIKTNYILELKAERHALIESAKTPTGKLGASKKALAILAKAEEIAQKINELEAKAEEVVAVYCSAEGYSDRPHHWDEKTGYHVHDDSVPLRGAVREVVCQEHRPPVTMTPEEIAQAVKAAAFYDVPAMASWTAVVCEDVWHGNGGRVTTPTLTLASPDGITILVRFCRYDREDEKPNGYTTKATGHVSFTSSQGERTFDRTGVEDSFYVRVSDTVEDVIRIFGEQVAKVAASRARIDKQEPIPGLGFLVTPERKAQIAATLKAGKSETFTPSGFGTGYRLNMRQRSRYDHRAKAETEAFFGVSPIYLETMDCD